MVRKQPVLDRLARIEGDVRSIRSTAEEGRDCSEVLLAAVRSALRSVGRLALEDHFETCLLNAKENTKRLSRR